MTGVDEFIDDGDQAFTVILDSAVSADGKYDGIDPSDVSCINTDDDVVGVTVTPTSGLTTTEWGGQASFTVVLTSQPSFALTAILGRYAQSGGKSLVVFVDPTSFEGGSKKFSQKMLQTSANFDTLQSIF